MEDKCCMHALALVAMETFGACIASHLVHPLQALGACNVNAHKSGGS